LEIRSCWARADEALQKQQVVLPMEVDGEPSWFAKEILHFTTIFIVNMDTQ